MDTIKFIALETAVARALQSGEPDANNMPPEQVISTGGAMPCRHCLEDIAAGEKMLIVAHRPFKTTQAYAEQGPIFLHAEACIRHEECPQPPVMFLQREEFLVRGYTQAERIKYGTGEVVKTASLAKSCAALLLDPEIDYVHVRSASNNCYQCRVERS